MGYVKWSEPIFQNTMLLTHTSIASNTSLTAASTSRMLTGMATNVVTRTSAAASCCKKCGTGGALLVNDGVALCPTCWYEKYRPNSTASATAP